MSFSKNNKEKLKNNEKPSLFKRIWEVRSISVLILVSLLLNIAGWFLLKWQIDCNQSTMILHYNSFLGIDVIDFNFQKNCFQVLLVPLSGLLIWLMNTFLGLILIKQSNFFSAKKDFNKNQLEKKIDEKIVGSYLLWIGSLLVQLIVLVYILAIIMVNK